MDESINLVDVSNYWMNSHFLLFIVICRKCSFWALLHSELSSSRKIVSISALNLQKCLHWDTLFSPAPACEHLAKNVQFDCRVRKYKCLKATSSLSLWRDGKKPRVSARAAVSIVLFIVFWVLRILTTKESLCVINAGHHSHMRCGKIVL